MTSLVSLSVPDSASTWARLGFVVDADASVTIGGVRFRFQGSDEDMPESGKGLTGWTLYDPSDSLPIDIDGIPTSKVARRDRPAAQVHPNGVTGIDHLVLRTHNLERTIRVFEELGMACRRRRDAGSNGSSITQQAFFWLGSPNDPDDRVVLEVVGQSVVDRALKDKPSTFFGIALVCEDLDATADFFGDLVKPPIDAVQRGRRIMAISARGGSTVAIALMTPHVKQLI